MKKNRKKFSYAISHATRQSSFQLIEQAFDYVKKAKITFYKVTSPCRRAKMLFWDKKLFFIEPNRLLKKYGF
jgi:hypothetical protein